MRESGKGVGSDRQRRVAIVWEGRVAREWHLLSVGGFRAEREEVARADVLQLDSGAVQHLSKW